MHWKRFIRFRSFLKQISFLALVMNVAGVSVYGDTEQEPTKPNVLFIAIDDLNDWTGILQGNIQARTPHMDTLASKFYTCHHHCRFGGL
jgi:hypothetical protein